MIYKLLAHLFRNNDLDWRYTPKPQHLIFYPPLLMALGVVTYMRDGWVVFGICSFLLGFSLGITIVLGMNWDKAIEYWETINKNAQVMMSIKDPLVRNEIWRAYGFNNVPTNAQVTERKTDEMGTFIQLTNHNLPVSPAVMQMIADKVLMTGNLNFKEEEYSRFVKGFRKVQKDFKKREFIKQNHIKNPRLSYSFTKKGIDVLYQFASEGIKIELKKRKGERNEP